MSCGVLRRTDTLRKIIARCESGGAMVQELCEFGDQQLSEETAKVFKKEKDMKKGTVCVMLMMTITVIAVVVKMYRVECHCCKNTARSE